MPAKFSLLAVVAAPLLPIALACGGDDGGGGIKVPDAGNTVDGKSIDAMAACTSAAYGTPSLGSNQQAKNYPAGSNSPHEIDFSGKLNADAAPDIMLLALFAGYGGFGSGDIRPGTYTITGDDTKFSTCGICPLIGTDVTQSGITDWYYATSGTITLTTVGTVGGTLVGSIANAQFVHVSSDANGNPGDDAINDGCSGSITSMNFNAAITAGGSGSATAGDPIARQAAAQRLIISGRHY